VSENNSTIHPKSVSYVVTDKVPTSLAHNTVGDVIKLLNTEKPDQFVSINYIYVLDSEKKLKGTVSVEEIFRNDHSESLANIMNTNLITVREHSHQEKAALLAIKNDLKAIPVTDKNDKFIGVITSESILNILHREHIEDMLHFAGLGKYKNFEVDLLSVPIQKQIKARLPWLIIGLVGGIFAASIVSGFDALLEKLVLLAAFLPAVIYIGDAVGSQSQTLIVRDLGLNEKLKIGKYLRKELLISISLGLIVGTLAGIISQVFWQNFTLALIVSVSFLLTIIVSAVVGVILPVIFEKFRIDPAVGSGPIATVIRDILSIVVYFTVAAIFLSI